MTSSRSTAAGFSLAELLIAMLVTMLVSGAVFGLMSAGQGAFRREPELTDRQQNIRLAMDVIQRDLAVAGVGVGSYDQVFTGGLDGFSAALPNGPSGLGKPDALEILGADGECTDVPALGVATDTVTTMFALPTCFGTAGPVAVTVTDSPQVIQWGFARGMTPVTGTTVNFAGPQFPPRTTVPTPLTGALRVTRLQLVRYEVADDTSTAPAVPSLWRSATGGRNPATAAYAPPGIGVPAALAGWQIVARGIEDLQITYAVPGGAIPGGVTPPAVVLANCNTLVKDVRVTLWARALAGNLQGQRTDGGAAAAVRGSLVSMTTPRAVLLSLRAPAPPPCTWN